MTQSYLAADDITPCKCDNCGETYPSAAALNPISDIDQRLDPGSIVPAGECPSCGALAYYDDEHAPEWSAQRRLHDFEKGGAA